MTRVYLRVVINGTDRNLWNGWGLKQNPFPQLGKAEWYAAERKIASLDGAPVTSVQDIRDRLPGFSAEFVEACIAHYAPGERVGFTVWWEER